MTEGIIAKGIVKQFSSRGGAYVSVPANLVGKEVWVIPVDKVKDTRISVSFQTKGEVVTVDKS